MNDEDHHRFHPRFPRTTPSLEALKAVVAARAARDLALAAFLKAERNLYDAEAEMQAVRFLRKSTH